MKISLIDASVFGQAASLPSVRSHGICRHSPRRQPRPRRYPVSRRVMRAVSRQTIVLSPVLIGLFLVALALTSTPARAVTVWTDWTSTTIGSNGSATGSIGGVGVFYSGELDGAVIDGSDLIWSPDSSFVGGTVTGSPGVVGDGLRLDGSSTGTNTLTFASPVKNPVLAIWSLGNPLGNSASFTFDQLTPTLQVGGPNAQFGGGPLSVSGSVVSGTEGNGVVQFAGTLSSISWTNTFEHFYAFTVGVNGPVGSTSVAEPPIFFPVVIALVGLFVSKRRLIAEKKGK